jgi:hypothetical protein
VVLARRTIGRGFIFGFACAVTIVVFNESTGPSRQLTFAHFGLVERCEAYAPGLAARWDHAAGGPLLGHMA